jgi:hypothetical protein
MLLYSAVFETQHMGIIVSEATTLLPTAVALGEGCEMPLHEIVAMIGIQDSCFRAHQPHPSLPAATTTTASSGCSGSL